MDQKRKTKGELLVELETLRYRVSELESAATSLKQSNEKLELLFNLLPIGVSVLDGKGRIVKENKTLEKILGISSSGLARGDFRNRKYLHSDGTEMTPDEFASSRISRGETAALNVETGVIKDDGSLSWLNVSAIAAPFADWSAIIVTSDITDRKRMEQELLASEERYRTLFEHNPDGVVVLNPETTEFIQFNDQVCQQLGYTREEFSGLTLDKIEADETIEESLAHIQQIMRLGRAEFETHQRTKQGEVRNVQVIAQLITAGRNPLFHCIWRDITERKRAVDALKKSEERFQLAMDATQDGLWDWDITTNQVYYSPAYFQMLGYSSSQGPASLKSWSDLIHPEDLDSTIAVNTDCIENRCERFEAEFRMLAKDGTWRWILGKGKAVARDDKGRAVRLIGTHTDITERKQAEEALRESEAAFRGYFNMGTIGMAVTSPQKGWIEVNDCLCTMMGYSRDELKHMSWAEITHPDDLAVDTELFDKVMSGKSDSYQLEKRFIRKNGNTIHTLLYVTCQRNRDGSVRYFLASLMDITERRRADEALRSSEARYRLISENVADVIWVLDPIAGRFKYVSPSVEKLRGYTPDEVMAQPVNASLTPKSLELVSKAIETRLPPFLKRGTGTESYTDQVDQPRKDGTIVNTEVTTTYLFNESGEVEIVGVSRDITERKKVEEALRMSEEKYRLLFDNAGDAIFIHDENGRMLAVNSLASKRLGYTVSELIDMTVDEIDSPEERQYAPQRTDQLIREGRLEFETVHQCKDGSLIPTEVSAQQIIWDGVSAIISICRDITERKRAEKALRESEEKLRTVFNTMEEGLALNELIFDENGDAIDYKILEINSAFERIAFLTREQAIGKCATEIYHMAPADIKAFWNLHRQNEHSIKTDMYIPEVKGWRHISTSKISGNRFATLFFDNTDQKNAEIALRESEERFRTLYETMTQGVVYHNASGQVISTNRMAEQILGISFPQMRGEVAVDPRWHAIHEDGSYFSNEAHPALVALRTGKPVENVVMGVFHPQNGNYVWIKVNAVPQFKDNEKEPYQVYATFDDISAIKRNADILNARLRLLEYAADHSVKELLQATLDEAGALVFSPIGFYHFVDPNQESLTLQAWSTRTRLEFCTASGEDSHYPVSHAGVWADGIRERRPIIHNSYAGVENKHGLPDGHAVVIRELVVPVMRGDRIVAIMGVGNKADDYNATDLEIVTALADFSWDIIQQRKTNDELRASEEQYRRLINLLPSGVVVHSEGKIELVNRAGNRFFGATDSDQLIGTLLLDRVHTDFREVVRERVRQSIELNREAEPIEEKLVRVDNTVFDAEVAAISVNYAGKPSTLAVFNDITQRKQRESELHAIAALSAALRTAPTRAEMLPVIVEQIVSLLSCDSVAIEILQIQTGEAIVEAAHGAWKLLVNFRQEYGTGLNSIISRTRKPYITQSLSTERNLTDPRWMNEGIHACAGIPLVAQGQLIGFIWMGRKTDIAANEVELLSAVADIAANAIHRATLHEKTLQDAAELAQAYDSTLEGWAYALELRDQETGGHTRRVVEKTLELARLMGVEDDDLENIRRGALLHDIGKMVVPDSVLLKPGTLNDREWEIMRRHPEYACELLKRIDYLYPAIDIPYCHHEKWDGTGYPRGLKGEQIPLSARIFAVVDVWDALTNDRPYRPAWSREAALEYIRQQSGRHFDPAVQNVFMQLVDNEEKGP